MIDIRELRIGNLVLNGFGQPIKIYNSISKYSVSGYNSETLWPIILTTEILDKCGFKKWGHSENDVNYTWSHLSMGLATIYWDSNHQCCHLEFEGTWASYQIKYLHQLQNLIFALTGEELTVNL